MSTTPSPATKEPIRRPGSLWLLCLLCILQGGIYTALCIEYSDLLLLALPDLIQLPTDDFLSALSTILFSIIYFLIGGVGFTWLTRSLWQRRFMAWAAVLILECVVLANDLSSYFLLGDRSLFPLFLTMALAAAVVLLLNQRDIVKIFHATDEITTDLITEVV